MNHARTVINSIGLGPKALSRPCTFPEPCKALFSLSCLPVSGSVSSPCPYRTFATGRANPSPSRPHAPTLPARRRAHDELRTRFAATQRPPVRLYASQASDPAHLSEKEYRSHPNRFKELPLREIRNILGTRIKEKTGNDLLKTLQKQRITGTLDHGVKVPGVDKAAVAKGLDWLRSKYPLDEDAAILKRIEHESKQMDKQSIADAEKLTWHPQQSAEQDGLYGKPMVDELAQQIRERKAAREKEAEEIRTASGDTRIAKNPRTRAVYTGSTESAEWVKRYKEKAMLSKMLEPPEMSAVRRLLPSAIFAALVISFCLFMSSVYKPVPREARLFPDTPPALVTVLSLIGLNVGVFALWRIPMLWRFMNRNFLLVPALPMAKSILGNIFSHQSFSHLAANMTWLLFIGTQTHDEVGRANFLAIYVASGVFSSFCSLTKLVLTKDLIQTTLGASGAITGLIGAWLWLEPDPSEEKKGGIPPLAKKIFLILLIVVEASVARAALLPKVDHVSHLGGYFAGLAGAEVLMWRARSNKQTGDEQDPLLEAKQS